MIECFKDQKIVCGASFKRTIRACIPRWNNHSWASHLLDGCRILYLGEIVIQELLSERLCRKPDINGVLLISE